MSGIPKIIAVAGGIRITVKVMPRSSRAEISGVRGEALVVRVTDPPIESRANIAVCRILAKRLGVARGRVTIVFGERSREKVVRVEGVSRKDALEDLGFG